MCTLMTQMIYVENYNNTYYNNQKFLIKNLKNYKTHKKLKFIKSSTLPSSSSSSTLLTPKTTLSSSSTAETTTSSTETLLSLDSSSSSSSLISSSVVKSSSFSPAYQQHYQHQHQQQQQQKQQKQQSHSPKLYSNSLNPKFFSSSSLSYRTNCDLYFLIPLLILLILITITNCSSEFNNNINYSFNYFHDNNNNNNNNNNNYNNKLLNSTENKHLINKNIENSNERLIENIQKRFIDDEKNYNEKLKITNYLNIHEKDNEIDNGDVDDEDNYLNDFNRNNLNDYYYFQNFKKKNRYSINNSSTMTQLKGSSSKGIENSDGNEISDANDGDDDEKDIEKLQQLVLQGLGLTKLPDISKINISQTEYITKYNEYTLRVRQRKQRELLLYNNLEYLEELNSPKTLKTYIHNSSDSELYLKYHLYRNQNHYYHHHRNTYRSNKNHPYYYSNFPNLFDHQQPFVEENDKSNNIRGTREYRRRRKRNTITRISTNDDDIHHTSSSSSSSSSSSKSINNLNSLPPTTTSSPSNDIVYVRFPIKIENESTSSSPIDIEEANLRLLLLKFKNKKFNHQNLNNNHSINVHNQTIIKNSINKNYSNYNINGISKLNNYYKNINHNNKNKSTNNNEKIYVNLKIYQLIEPFKKLLLDNRKIEIDNNYYGQLIDSQWLDFDVTKAVENWINGKQLNLGLEIHCENCKKYDVKILHDTSSLSSINYDINTNNENLNPVLNIIGYFQSSSSSSSSSSSTGSTGTATVNLHRDKRSRQNHHFLQNVKRKPRKTDCYEENKKCCRHTMEVVFKEIKGFEFIIQPKVFDAGYCRGKCPPRYNPAHHHALLQSLIWKQDKNKAPRPCCAPSKLVELEVLHVDEKDPKKLKVSTWTDMRALECACS